jgi:hypothetical protein
MEGHDEFDNRNIVYSRTIKTGKRIYYLDVRQSRNNELYLSMTESKKMPPSEKNEGEIHHEKHKIFIYREDLSQFTDALIDVIRYIKDHEAGPEKEEP